MLAISDRGLLTIPLRLVFTDEGITQFMRKRRPLTRFTTSDNREEYGLSLTNFTPATVQKLLRLGFVRSIDVTLDEIVRFRKELIDISKLITYSMLYMQYEHEVYQELLRSSLVTQWNRKNAKHSIDHGSRIDRRRLVPWLEKREPELRELQERVMGRVDAALSTKSALDASERQIYRWTAESFLESIDPLFWFMLIAHKGSEESTQLLERASIRLLRYLETVSISEYLGLLILELLTHLRHAAPLTQETDRQGQPVSVLWKLRKRSDRKGDRGRLHVVVSGSEARFEEVQGEFKDRGSLSGERSLHDFYRNAALTGGEGQTGLGLYYLSFLNDVCRKEGVGFESFVNQPASGQALLNLVLHFGE
ncbi:MAG: hypothetical protein ACOCWS_00040 [Alkalispirochaetaceae bacterium]